MNNFKHISGEEAQKIIKENNFSAGVSNINFELTENVGGEYKVRLYEGDQHFTENFIPGYLDNVIILGNVTADGIIKCDMENNFIAVSGNVTAKNILSFGEFNVKGDVTVEGTIYCDSSNDYGLIIKGNLKTGALVESGTACDIAGSIDSEHIYPFMNSIKSEGGKTEHKTDKEIKDVLISEVLEDDWPEPKLVTKALEEGKKIVK